VDKLHGCLREQCAGGRITGARRFGDEPR